MDGIKVIKWSRHYVPEFNRKETPGLRWSNPALSCFQQLYPHNPVPKRNLLPSTSRKRLETLYTAQISRSRNSLLPFRVLHSWESQFLDKLLRSPGSLRRRKGFWALEEIGIWSSQGREKDNFFFFFFKPRADDCTTKQLLLLKDMLFFKLHTSDYIRTMYPAWGHVSPSWEPSD